MYYLHFTGSITCISLARMCIFADFYVAYSANVGVGEDHQSREPLPWKPDILWIGTHSGFIFPWQCQCLQLFFTAIAFFQTLQMWSVPCSELQDECLFWTVQASFSKPCPQQTYESRMNPGTRVQPFLHVQKGCLQVYVDPGVPRSVLHGECSCNWVHRLHLSCII